MFLGRHWRPGGPRESVGAFPGFHDDAECNWHLLGGGHIGTGQRPHPPCQSIPTWIHWGGYSQLLGHFLCK